MIRQAARVVLLDDRDRVLSSADSTPPTRTAAPGGSHQEAASTPANRSKPQLEPTEIVEDAGRYVSAGHTRSTAGRCGPPTISNQFTGLATVPPPRWLSVTNLKSRTASARGEAGFAVRWRRPCYRRRPRRDGGTGRRGGLKNRSPQGGGGSTPPLGTSALFQRHFRDKPEYGNRS